MGFHRVHADEGGRLGAPSRAGVGFTANVIPKIAIVIHVNIIFRRFI